MDAQRFDTIDEGPGRAYGRRGALQWLGGAAALAALAPHAGAAKRRPKAPLAFVKLAVTGLKLFPDGRAVVVSVQAWLLYPQENFQSNLSGTSYLAAAATQQEWEQDTILSYATIAANILADKGYAVPADRINVALL